MQKVWLKHYPDDVPFEINPEQFSSVIELFKESCEKYSELTAFSNLGTKMSYKELDQLSDDFAGFLQNTAKVKKGDRVALQLPNVLQFPVALFGVLKAGGVVVNTNPLYTTREMLHQFKDSGATTIVILANFADKLEEVLAETQIETVVVTELGDLLGWPKSLIINWAVKYLKKMVPKYSLPKAYSFFEALDLGKQSPLKKVSLEAEDLAFLQYTGGTTGVAKGAMLTHRNIVANMLQISEWIRSKIDEGSDVVIAALPMYHIFSLTVNCLTFLRFGSENLLVTNPRDIGGFIKTLRKSRFTCFPGLNTLFLAMMNHPDFKKINFTQLKLSVAGGMALQRAVAERWMKETQTLLIEGYGLTETSPVVCCNPVNGKDKVGSIGLPLPSTDIKLIGENDEDLGPGETGELCVRGPQVMKGYWNRPDETDKIMLAGDWLRTGDIAQIDEQGYVKIVDRKKDMILVSGFNVYPNEIEDVVMMLNKVQEVAAVGEPDERSGEVVKIYVVAKDKSLTADELIQHCKDNLAGYKIPKYVEFRDELPKTNVGKILRRELRS